MSEERRIHAYSDRLKKILSKDEQEILNEILNKIHLSPNLGSLPLINSLKISNLSIFAEDFPGLKFSQGINLIKGATGAGRSTISNIIEFNIFGKSQNYEFKDFSKKASVDKPFSCELIFTMNKNQYKLIRTIPANQDRHNPELYQLEFRKSPITNQMEHLWSPIPLDSIGHLNKYLENIFKGDLKYLHKFFEILYLTDRADKYIIDKKILGTKSGDFIRDLLYLFTDDFLLPEILLQIDSAIKRNKNEIRKFQILIDNFDEKAKSIERIDVKELFRKITELKEKEKLNKDIREKLKEERKNLREKIIKFDQDDEYFKLKKDLSNLLVTREQIEKDIENSSNFQKRIQKQQEYNCSICHRSYNMLAEQRKSNNLCPECGQEIVIEEVIKKENTFLPKVKKEIADLNLKIKVFKDRKEGLEKGRDEINDKLDVIEKQNEEGSKEITKLQSNVNLAEIKLDINERIGYENSISTLKIQIENLEKLREKIKFCFFPQINKIYREMKNNFLAYQISIFDSILGSIDYNFEFIESKTEFQELSTGEQRVLDVLFRLAIVKSLVELKFISKGFLLLDSPDMSIDSSLQRSLARLLNSLKPQIDFIITASNETFLKELDAEFIMNLDQYRIRRKKIIQKSITEFISPLPIEPL